MFYQLPLKKVRVGLIALIGLLAAALLPATVVGRPNVAPATVPATLSDFCETGPSFDLQTATGFIQTPDGNSIFMWGYTLAGDDFQMPGPILCVNEGDSVTINLTNNLPAPTSIVFPGQTGVTHNDPTPGLFTGEADPGGGTVTYNFTAAQPGTYLYESGTDPYQQVQMGLYGAIIVRPALGANFAYNDPNTRFDPDREFLILIHDLDPDLHHAVEQGETYDVTTKHDHYWFVNGRSFPDTIAPSNVSWLPAQPYGALVQVEATDPDDLSDPPDPANDPPPALIRYANAGMENHPFHPHGNHLRVIGRDGRLLSQSFENFSTTIGSGQTYDLLFRWINVEEWTPDTNGDIKANVTFPNPLYPGIYNLVFKDGVTWYSGDPDLGAQGEFPVGTTLINECGEFYFPWHSHALNEFQNFDEGFGGLATLVRVDPPDGCP